MGVSINTYFHPFRLDSRTREPVELTVELVNRDQKEKRLTLELALAKGLGLDKSAFKNMDLIRIEKMAAGEKKVFRFDVFGSTILEKKDYPIKIRVLEHQEGYQNYKYVQREYNKVIELGVK
jgi:hypothetical protein